MKKTLRKLDLNRETLRSLESNLFFVQAAATGTCAGSGCASCGQNECNPGNISDPVPAGPVNPITYLTSSSVQSYATGTTSLQF